MAAEQNNTNTIAENVCRASCENGAEQHAHETAVDDSVPPRMLCQAAAPPGLVDAPLKTRPDAVNSSVDASPPLHSFTDEAHNNNNINNKSCSIFDNLTTDNDDTQQQTPTQPHHGQDQEEGTDPPLLPKSRAIDMMCATCHIMWFHFEVHGILTCARCHTAAGWTQCCAHWTTAPANTNCFARRRLDRQLRK